MQSVFFVEGFTVTYFYTSLFAPKEVFVEAKDRIIVALDVSDVAQGLRLVRALKDEVGGFKIGLEAMTAWMKAMLGANRELAYFASDRYNDLFTEIGTKLMWDGKFDDIPNTVGAAAKNVGAMGAGTFTVHASAGKKALEAAVAHSGHARVIAVTVLTSIGADDPTECESIFGAAPSEKVRQFAKVAVNAGVEILVCAPVEAEFLRADPFFNALELWVPNVRSSQDAVQNDDQNLSRTRTPAEVAALGGTRVIIGREITRPKGVETPVEAARRIAIAMAAAAR